MLKYIGVYLTILLLTFWLLLGSTIASRIQEKLMIIVETLGRN